MDLGVMGEQKAGFKKSSLLTRRFQTRQWSKNQAQFEVQALAATAGSMAFLTAALKRDF